MMNIGSLPLFGDLRVTLPDGVVPDQVWSRTWTGVPHLPQMVHKGWGTEVRNGQPIHAADEGDSVVFRVKDRKHQDVPAFERRLVERLRFIGYQVQQQETIPEKK